MTIETDIQFLSAIMSDGDAMRSGDFPPFGYFRYNASLNELFLFPYYFKFITRGKSCVRITDTPRVFRIS